MSAMLQSVCRGLNDAEPMVRNAALFALGQFSEHLQVWTGHACVCQCIVSYVAHQKAIRHSHSTCSLLADMGVVFICFMDGREPVCVHVALLVSKDHIAL